MKLTKEDIDKVRHIEGFPIARDEDIIALSDPILHGMSQPVYRGFYKRTQ